MLTVQKIQFTPWKIQPIMPIKQCMIPNDQLPNVFMLIYRNRTSLSKLFPVCVWRFNKNSELCRRNRNQKYA